VTGTITLNSRIDFLKKVTVIGPGADQLLFDGSLLGNSSTAYIFNFNLFNEIAKISGVGLTEAVIGISVLASSTLIMEDMVIEAISSGIKRQGVWIRGNGVSVPDVTIRRSKICGGYDDGVSLFNTTKLSLENSLLTGNVNAISNFIPLNAAPEASEILIKNSTLANNSSRGILTNRQGTLPPVSNFTIQNSIIAGNGSEIVDFSASGNFNVNNSLIQGTTTNITFVDGMDGNIIGQDPLFTDGNPADACGGDFSLQETSLAIDAGNNGDAPIGNDLAGNARIDNSIVDMGAFEYQSDPGGGGNNGNGGAPIPTMNQWALFLFGLLITTLGVITLYNFVQSGTERGLR
jgi:hypothetical protein